MSHTKPAYMNVLIVQEYETASGKGRNWIKVGVAFPHTDGPGFNIDLSAFPRDGKLIVLPPQSDGTDDRTSESRSKAAGAKAR